METDAEHYAKLAQHELDAAQASIDPDQKIAHLDLAARYATLGDRRRHLTLREPRK